MGVTKEQVLAALRSVKYPGFTRDIVSFGIVRDTQIEGGKVRIGIELGPGNPAVSSLIEKEARAVVLALEGVTSVEVRIAAGSTPPGARPAGTPAPAPPQATVRAYLLGRAAGVLLRPASLPPVDSAR